MISERALVAFRDERGIVDSVWESKDSQVGTEEGSELSSRSRAFNVCWWDVKVGSSSSSDSSLPAPEEGSDTSESESELFSFFARSISR